MRASLDAQRAKPPSSAVCSRLPITSAYFLDLSRLCKLNQSDCEALDQSPSIIITSGAPGEITTDIREQTSRSGLRGARKEASDPSFHLSVNSSTYSKYMHLASWRLVMR